jgi:hypothetical protein
MTDTTPTPTRTVLERLLAGETVPFECLSDDDLRALMPDFADRWRAAMRDVAPVAAPETEAA